MSITAAYYPDMPATTSLYTIETIIEERALNYLWKSSKFDPQRGDKYGPWKQYSHINDAWFIYSYQSEIGVVEFVREYYVTAKIVFKNLGTTGWDAAYAKELRVVNTYLFRGMRYKDVVLYDAPTRC